MTANATLQARILAAWIDYLRQNRGAEERPDLYYALAIENVRGDGEEFELCLAFRAGQIYCCSGAGCHHGLHTEKAWLKLRAALAASGVEPQKPLVVHVHTQLQAGARLHYGRSGQPVLETRDAGPWTETVVEPTPTPASEGSVIQ
jgi:hypothetical protein